MNDLLPYIIIGVTAGSIFGLAGVGLVLTYKTSGIFNFAHGAVATVAAYTFYFLHVEHGMPWPFAAFLSVAGVGAIVGILLELLARRLANVAAVWQIVATIGLILAVEGFLEAQYGAAASIYPSFLPTGEAFRLAGVIVSTDQVVIAVTALVLTALLFVFFRTRPLGLAMRGVVDNSELLDSGGTNPAAVRRVSWIVGTTFAALAGVLLAPSLNLDAMLLTMLVVQAFGAAAVGFFSSMPLAYVGGLLIGIAGAIMTKVVAEHPSLPWLNGIPASIPFLILLVVLVATPRHRLTSRRLISRVSKNTYRAPARIQAIGAVVVIAAASLVPMLVSDAMLGVYTVALTSVVLFLSLGLLVRTSGQVSLCHVAFAAVGATAFSHFSNMHIPWLIALLLAGLVAVPVGALVAIPAIRLSGVFLALATFGFGVAMEQAAYPLAAMFGSNALGLNDPRPSLWGLDGDTAFYYVVLAFVLGATALILTITRGRLGRLLSGMADSPLALATHGASVNTAKVLVFCISAFLAAIYGGLYGAAIHTVSATQFGSFTSLTLVALLAIVWGGEPWYALFAAIGLNLIPAYVSGANVNNYLNVLFGVSAVALAVQNGSHTPRLVQKLADRVGGRSRSTPATGGAEQSPAAPDRPSPQPPRVRDDSLGLIVANVSVRFGGVTAVNNASLVAPLGRITGLIGPNGAGKTSTFNVCSGLVKPSAGTVSLDGRTISRLSPSARAERGLGRSFQRMELFDSLTVRDNVGLGREAAMAGHRPWHHLLASPRELRERDAAVDDAISLCSIVHLSDLVVGELSTGERRLVELARCLAGQFTVLLLDEPSSGLDVTETKQFGAVLRRVVAERGVGILLVEHDMSLVMRVCDYLYVLDFGVQVFEGTPAQVNASEAVRLAYLGSDAGSFDAASADARAEVDA